MRFLSTSILGALLLVVAGCGDRGADEPSSASAQNPSLREGAISRPAQDPGLAPDAGGGAGDSPDPARQEGPAAIDPEAGAVLYKRHCGACHGPEGDGDSINAHYFPGIEWSDMSRPGFWADRGPERIKTAILDGGRAVSGGSQWMPAWRHTLDAGQVANLLAFLQDLPRREKPERRNLSGSSDSGCATCHRAAGAELVRQTNCAGCHELEGFERRVVAPDLAGVGLKFTRQFLYRFLRMPFNRRQPGYRPLEIVRMPDFRLTPEERVDLTEFLAARTALELAEEYTPPAEISPEALEAAAREVLDKYACQGCHKLGSDGGKVGPDLTDLGAGQWRPEWVYNWIRDPLRYDPLSPMPRLQVSPEEARTLTHYLTTRGMSTAWTQSHVSGDGSSTPDGEPREGGDPAYPELSDGERAAAGIRGETLFQALGCLGCHPLGDRSYDPKIYRVGPKLDMTAHRLDRNWLYDFLWSPSRVRPKLAPARMPRIRYTQDEIISVLDYLTDHADLRWGSLGKAYEAALAAHGENPDPATGRELFVSSDCHSCHEVSGVELPPVKDFYYEPEENAARSRWAPDLGLARGRLQFAWAFLWIRDPTTFNEESLMPKIRLEDDQIVRILDFVLEKRPDRQDGEKGGE